MSLSLLFYFLFLLFYLPKPKFTFFFKQEENNISHKIVIIKIGLKIKQKKQRNLPHCVFHHFLSNNIHKIIVYQTLKNVFLRCLFSIYVCMYSEYSQWERERTKKREKNYVRIWMRPFMTERQSNEHTNKYRIFFSFLLHTV